MFYRNRRKGRDGIGGPETCWLSSLPICPFAPLATFAVSLVLHPGLVAIFAAALGQLADIFGQLAFALLLCQRFHEA